jgi:hypothetical protein
MERVEKTLAATSAIVDNGAPVNVVNAADAPVAGSPGTATVTAGALINAKLTV